MITLDRRRFLQSGTAAALAGAGGMLTLPGHAVARSSASTAPLSPSNTPGFYRFSVGEYTITVLGDGNFTLPAEIFGANVTAEQRADYYTSRYLPLDRIPLPANPAVIDTGTRIVLVDAGTGASGDPQPSTGRLPAALEAAGIDSGEVDLVIVTHAHGDHLGGLVDVATGEARFPNAEVVFSDVEHAFWTAADVRSRVPDWVVDAGIVDFNDRVFAVVGDRVRTVPMDAEVTPGVRSVASPGHTPGHIGVLVDSAGEQLLMVGDAIVTWHTQFEQPEWQLAFDLDLEQGVRTRRRLLDWIATDRLQVQGFHLPFPGVGHALRAGGAFRWLATA